MFQKEERRDIIECLKQVEFFKNLLNQPLFQSRVFLFLEHINTHLFKKGQIIVNTNDSKHVYFVLKGKVVSLIKNPNSNSFQWNGFVQRISKLMRLGDNIDYECELIKYLEEKEDQYNIEDYFYRRNRGQNFGQNCVLFDKMQVLDQFFVTEQESFLISIEKNKFLEIFNVYIQHFQFIFDSLSSQFSDVNYSDLQKVSFKMRTLSFKQDKLIFEQGTQVNPGTFLEKKVLSYRSGSFLGFEDFFQNNEKHFFTGYVKAGTTLCIIDLNNFEIDDQSNSFVQALQTKSYTNFQEKLQKYKQIKYGNGHLNSNQTFSEKTSNLGVIGEMLDQSKSPQHNSSFENNFNSLKKQLLKYQNKFENTKKIDNIVDNKNIQINNIKKPQQSDVKPKVNLQSLDQRSPEGQYNLSSPIYKDQQITSQNQKQRQQKDKIKGNNSSNSKFQNDEDLKSVKLKINNNDKYKLNLNLGMEQINEEDHNQLSHSKNGYQTRKDQIQFHLNNLNKLQQNKTQSTTYLQQNPKSKLQINDSQYNEHSYNKNIQIQNNNVSLKSPTEMTTSPYEPLYAQQNGEQFYLSKNPGQIKEQKDIETGSQKSNIFNNFNPLNPGQMNKFLTQRVQKQEKVDFKLPRQEFKDIIEKSFNNGSISRPQTANKLYNISLTKSIYENSQLLQNQNKLKQQNHQNLETQENLIQNILLDVSHDQNTNNFNNNIKQQQQIQNEQQQKYIQNYVKKEQAKISGILQPRQRSFKDFFGLFQDDFKNKNGYELGNYNQKEASLSETNLNNKNGQSFYKLKLKSQCNENMKNQKYQFQSDQNLKNKKFNNNSQEMIKQMRNTNTQINNINNHNIRSMKSIPDLLPSQLFYYKSSATHSNNSGQPMKQMCHMHASQMSSSINQKHKLRNSMCNQYPNNSKFQSHQDFLQEEYFSEVQGGNKKVRFQNQNLSNSNLNENRYQIGRFLSKKSNLKW
ncbi:Cyclic nucleotide-binding protein [Pseudocohnilembus persalinus]|uniref:Cyclic nucleotide-binding protein n=1 Tax=Pseudocohnilembus persalinus TaxID=266149 RepID=A0A0V0R2M8_PSEPJ|nr:Cyclic nucleotide-binding protein [Pseudocohnilembus persalinus]|eukprot:KRX08767.1 Cyclic nucleotide-binding protein [Pseudocohnilembus persalinus]